MSSELTTVVVTIPPLDCPIGRPSSTEVSWPNLAGGPMYILGVDLWIGEDYGLRSDTQLTFLRASDGMVMGLFQWDHYNEPVGNSETAHFVFPGHFTLQNKDSVKLILNVTAFGIDTSLTPTPKPPSPPQVAATALMFTTYEKQGK
jgi:hypothetical protein